MITHRGGSRVISASVLRAAIAAAAVVGSVFVVIVRPITPAGASVGIVPPSNPNVNVSPQVMPACSTTPVDDTSNGCTDSVLHNINYARWLEGLGSLVLPTDYATDSVPVQQLILTDEERGDRGLPQFSGLDPALNVTALTGAVAGTDPSLPIGYTVADGGSIFAQDYTPLGADFAWMYNDGYGGTNLDCTSQSDPNCWGHRDNILGPWHTVAGSQTMQMGDADTPTGRYTQIFADQTGTPDADSNTFDPSTLPTPTTATAPDVVQVLPASSSRTAAGTPVTIEGNYFGSSPQVYFGGVAATDVHVNWNGELVANAPADPLGTAPDTVTVTVATGAGSSSSTGVPKVNQFTYAASGAPSITSISSASGPQVPSAGTTITIHGTNFIPGIVAPIVDFGNVASLGLVSATSSSITTTIPPSINPGSVNITVTTSGGTSTITPADVYTYTGSGSSVAPAMTSTPTTTFSSGTNNVFTVTTSGTPAVSSITDTAFSGCSPSVLPASMSLVYTGGSTATLDGNPQPGDGGTYIVCLQASNGIVPAATQLLTVTVNAPPAPPPPPPPPPPPSHGYWLVGSDGGIFTFGSAQFHGSTGGMSLQRPVVGITPTADRGGYWLVASDGGIFAFGDSGFFGSIPGAGLHPAGSGPHSLNAPIVGMVPSSDGGGYFMVASDGGVFAFGDARFEGSCPGIGGCSGAAVAVVPDATGNGYWVITKTGNVYTFGDAANYGAPGAQASPMTSAVATSDGGGYWILDSAGEVFSYGNATPMGGLAPGAAGGFNPASAIFSTSDGDGYWIVTALGSVAAYGDAPNDGDMSGTHLNGPIIAASGS